MREYHYEVIGVAGIGDHGREFRLQVEADDHFHAVMRAHRCMRERGMTFTQVDRALFVPGPVKTAGAYRLQ